jgi:hypothetical protein
MCGLGVWEEVALLQALGEFLGGAIMTSTLDSGVGGAANAGTPGTPSKNVELALQPNIRTRDSFGSMDYSKMLAFLLDQQLLLSDAVTSSSFGSINHQ